jgi:type III restriction enzyme
MYRSLAAMACQRITNGIVERMKSDERPIRATLDPYNPEGSTRHVNFNSSKATRWKTDPRKCHVNWVVCDSDWEAEFCRVADAHARVRAYVKNQGLGFEVPYLFAAQPRRYLPDFIVVVDDGRGEEDALHLVVEIKGYRREDAKEKKAAMESYWVPGVNALGTHGRWAFAELTDPWEFEAEFNRMVDAVAAFMD